MGMLSGTTVILTLIGVDLILGTTEAVYDTFKGKDNVGEYNIDDLPKSRFKDAK